MNEVDDHTAYFDEYRAQDPEEEPDEDEDEGEFLSPCSL
jgi:hypothetical protein